MPLSLIRRKQARVPGFAEFSEPINLLRNLLKQEVIRPFGSLMPELGPALDVKETSKAFMVQADVPGLKKEHLDITLSGNRLTLAGKWLKEVKEEEKEGETYLLRERHQASFSRSFNLPEDVDPDKIQAELADGVLFLMLPKSPEARSRKIAILGH